MTAFHLVTSCLRGRIVVAGALSVLPIATLPAQTVSRPSAADAATLAKYDRNHDGILDSAELALKQADDAKVARGVGQTPEGEKKEDVVQLSPFEVSAAEDRGYSAASTLAGTRLNSKLEDIAGSVSVVTKQQLLDTAALDINDIFLFEVGTEGTGQFTDLTSDGRGDYDNVSGNPTGANRMRGLSQANIAVGGFTASSTIPIDIYNIDAVEIARGPNSNLAGLSDAGGTVNLITSRANVNRESTSVTARFDSYGGYRGSLDLNRPLIRNKLSVRFSAMYQEQGFVRKPSVDRTDRQQIALTYRPFTRTNLTASFESFHEWARRANSLTPRDTISVWRSRGSPTYDPVTQTFTVNGVRSAPITTMTGTLPSGLALFGSSNVRNFEFIDGGTIQLITKAGNPSNNATTPQQLTQSNSDTLAGPLFKPLGLNDRSIYDWTDINLAAPNYQIQRAGIANVKLEQGILGTARQRLDLELAWRREDQKDYRRAFIAQQDGVGNTLEIDTNERLLDGRPNPYFLRPYIGGVNPQIVKKPVFNDSYRWQLAYQLDLRQEKNLLKWLGFHRAIGYQEYRLNIQPPERSSLRYHDSIVDSANFLGTGFTNPTATTNLTNSVGALVYPLYFFGNTKGGGVEYANTGPANPTGRFSANYFGGTPAQWNTEQVTLKEIYFAIGQQKKKVRTLGGSIQSFLLNDQIVTTFGERRDRVYTEDNLGTTLTNGFFDEANLYNFGVNKRWRFGATRTKGVVVKPFRGFSRLNETAERGTGLARFLAQAVRGFNVHYNQSDSFQPVDTAYNLYLQELPNPTGKSKEYGFSLNMFDNRLYLRVTHFDTMQFHTRSGIGTVATRAMSLDFDVPGQTRTFDLFQSAQLWQQQLHPEFTPSQVADAAARQIGYTVDYIASVNGKAISDVNDAQSKGWEVELQFNPSRYWTLKATGGQQVAIDTNVSLFIQKFIDERMPFWTSVTAPDGTAWWTTRQGSDGIPRDYFINNILNPLNLAITTQGKRKPQTREYTFNVVTNYQLAGIAGGREWLKRMSVGGAFRWASKGAIGYYGAAPDSDGVVRRLDRNRPYYDKPVGNLDLLLSYNTRLFRDKIRTRFQLNVRNVTEDGHLQGVAVNPDGRFWQYRIIDPRQFIFTTTFDL